MELKVSELTMKSIEFSQISQNSIVMEGDDERGVERGRKPHPLQENTQTHASTAQNLHTNQLPRLGGVYLPGSCAPPP